MKVDTGCEEVQPLIMVDTHAATPEEKTSEASAAPQDLNVPGFRRRIRPLRHLKPIAWICLVCFRVVLSIQMWRLRAKPPPHRRDGIGRCCLFASGLARLLRLKFFTAERHILP